ncbi:MAG: Gfo/Idh/MocA family oxidoreductase [Vibrio sp.]
MKIGIVGLGGIFEVAYLPAFEAFQNLSLEEHKFLGKHELPEKPIELFGYAPQVSEKIKNVKDLNLLPTYQDLLQIDLDILLILTPPETHYDLLVEALNSSARMIVIEKPVVADLAQLAQLKALLTDSNYADRVLALDHWTGRNGVQSLLMGKLDNTWQPLSDNAKQNIIPQIEPIQPQDILQIDGLLLEPCGYNEKGEAIALNFATGLEDTRQFFHPDGVILDIGTHVLTMMRDCLSCFQSESRLSLQVEQAKSRLGQPIEIGDITTAEGEAKLVGHCGNVPISLHLNKYAGLEGGQKGMNVKLSHDRKVWLDRLGSDEILGYEQDGQVWQWIRYGALYQHTIFNLLQGYPFSTEQLKAMTSRRIEEVECLLNLNQQLRGKH